jgi:hypothetical protein
MNKQRVLNSLSNLKRQILRYDRQYVWLLVGLAIGAYSRPLALMILLAMLGMVPVAFLGERIVEYVMRAYYVWRHRQLNRNEVDNG